MDDLDITDLRHVIAAEGWLELGNHLEANAELEQISASTRAHPEVLEIRCKIYEKVGNWRACFDIASAIVTLAPDTPFGWIRRSFALHEMKRTKEALERLEPAMELFPSEIVIYYNLACYECVSGNIGQAQVRLAQALEIAEKSASYDEWRLAALDDPDLAQIWQHLGKL
jgi:tetratricopeptide (TPR) repeat protein